MIKDEIVRNIHTHRRAKITDITTVKESPTNNVTVFILDGHDKWSKELLNKHWVVTTYEDTLPGS